ncbi:hypothetical protein SS05631_b58350 (plasmid) [Sinorhizobium sp. CCBAU 05631]|nr:hypothetical protein SS05631_b58350 [Sinorhizobium sp. CCBAU 05631]
MTFAGHVSLPSDLNRTGNQAAYLSPSRSLALSQPGSSLSNAIEAMAHAPAAWFS